MMKIREVQTTFVGAERLVKAMPHLSTKVCYKIASTLIVFNCQYSFILSAALSGLNNFKNVKKLSNRLETERQQCISLYTKLLSTTVMTTTSDDPTNVLNFSMRPQHVRTMRDHTVYGTPANSLPG